MSQTNAVVIIGASLAGAKVAESVRAEGFVGPIRLIGREAHFPYERPPLSKGLLQGKVALDKPRVLENSFYARHDIDMLLGVEATAVDLAAGQVELDGGRRIPFATLVLATGSSVRRLSVVGANLAHVHYLRTLDDALALREALLPGRRVVVIGGSWIGTEVAASARVRGADVLLIDRSSTPLERVLGTQVGRYFATLHTGHGVDLRPGTEVERLEGTNQVTGVRLTDGSTVEADAVVVGVGVTPNTGLADSAGLALDNGVLVDALLRTSDPRVYAIGDIANQLHPLLGTRIRVEHWSNALNQGICAGRNIAGKQTVYDRVPYFFSDQYDMGMEYSGWPLPWDRVVFRGNPDDGAFIAFYLKGNRVVGGANINVWKVNEHIQSLVRSGRQVKDDQLADPDTDLAELAAHESI